MADLVNTSGAPALEIDFVSDVVCPWCAIGLNSLLIALERLGPALGEVRLRFAPFELNPTMGTEGEDIVAHLSRKYGMDAAQVRANQEAIRQRGAEVGFDFRMDRRSRTWNTFDAHRLLHWAETVSPAAALRCKQALLTAYFTEGQNPGSAEVLRAAAARAGLDDEAARAVIESQAFADEVRSEEAFWQGAGLRAVPGVVVNRRHLISGGQPPEAYAEALSQIADEARLASAHAAPAPVGG